MRPSALLAALVLLAAPAHTNDVATWTPEMAMRVKRVTDVRVSPDGTRAAFVVASAVMEGKKSEWLSHVHVGRADGSGTFALTAGEKSDTAPAWSPDGKWIAFLSARGDAKGEGSDKKPKANVWRIRVDGGEAEQVTGELGGITALQWSPDGRSIAFVMPDPRSEAEAKADEEKSDVRVVDEDWKMHRLYVVPVEKDADGKRPVRKLTTGALSLGSPAGGPTRFEWSPDGKSIVFAHQPSPLVDEWTKWDVSVVDVATGTVRPLAATRAAESDPAFSPDGKWIAYFVSNDPPTWRRRGRVAVVPAAGGSPRLLAETHDQQPDIVGWTRDGRVLVSETWRTVARVAALPADGGPAVFVSPEDVMVASASVNAGGTHVGFVSQSPDKPVEAWAGALAPRFTPVQVSRVQDLTAVAYGRTEVLAWRARRTAARWRGCSPIPSATRPGHASRSSSSCTVDRRACSCAASPAPPVPIPWRASRAAGTRSCA